jgi:hypothetical protein
MLLARESSGVKRRDVDCAREAREDSLVAHSVDVDPERELLEPLVYEEGRNSNRDAWIGLAMDTRGVRGRLSPAGRDMLRRGAGEASRVDTAPRPASFNTMRGCYVSAEGIRDMLSWFSEPTGETFKGGEGAPVWWM